MFLHSPDIFSVANPLSSGHVWMWELDYKESWALKNWCFWTVVLEKILESPLDCKEIQPVYPKGDQSWVFTGRTDVEAATPVLWPPDAKSWLIRKDTDAGKDWGQEEKGTTEDEMVGWHHRLNEHGFGSWTPGAGNGQGGLECCSLWGCKESDKTERLSWPTRLISLVVINKTFWGEKFWAFADRSVSYFANVWQTKIYPPFLYSFSSLKPISWHPER